MLQHHLFQHKRQPQSIERRVDDLRESVKNQGAFDAQT
jgi:hypothetical protein